MALRCQRAMHMVGDDTGRITRLCRDCSRHQSSAASDVAVYHRWRFSDGHWVKQPDVVKRTPRG